MVVIRGERVVLRPFRPEEGDEWHRARMASADDRTQFLKPAAKWAADVRFADGTRKRVRFSPNRDAARCFAEGRRLSAGWNGLRWVVINGSFWSWPALGSHR